MQTMHPPPHPATETHNPSDGSDAEAAHPYARLTPDLVLDALAGIGLYGDGRLMALGSYENRVYQVTLEDGSRVVAKFYRPGRWSDAQILEEHDFSLELAGAEVPVVAPLVIDNRTLHRHEGFGFAVSPWRGGRTPELDDFEVLEWTGRFLARIHTVGALKPFTVRPALDLQTFGTDSRDWLMQHDILPLDQASAWHKACDEALNIIGNQLHPTQPLRLHGDCHPGNVLWTPVDETGGGPHFVDLDDARSGPAVQDLWMLLSGERPQRSMQLSTLLDGYEQFRDFDRRELAFIEPLRTLRLIHYSAWLARRYADPIFPINFPWFGSSDYWRGQIDMLHEQIEAMQEPPLMV